MSFVWDTFESKAIEIVNTISGLTVVWSHQNAPRPVSSFVALQIISMTPQGNPEEVQDGGDNHRVRIWNTLTLQVKVVGGISSKASHLIQRALGQRIYLDEFASVEAGLATVSQINNVPVVRGNGWENQSVFDVVFNVPTEELEEVGYISKVTGAGNIGSKTVSLNVEE